MKKILSVLIASFTLLVLSGTSYAEAYFSIFGGASIPHDSDVKLTAGTAPGGSGELNFKTGFNGGLRLGAWFPNAPHLGFQIEASAQATDLKDLNYSTGQVSKTTGGLEIYSAMLNILFRTTGEKTRAYAGGGAGAHWAILGTTAFIPNFFAIPGAREPDVRFGWQAIAGIDTSVSKHWSLFAEYKFSAVKFKFREKYGIDIDEYMVSHFIAGATYAF